MKAWIAREYSQELGLFLHKPKKGVCCWGIDVPMTHITEQDLPQGVNPKWSDDEPIEVELKIERAKIMTIKERAKHFAYEEEGRYIANDWTLDWEAVENGYSAGATEYAVTFVSPMIRMPTKYSKRC